jgi:hypothetical protein
VALELHEHPRAGGDRRASERRGCERHLVGDPGHRFRPRFERDGPEAAAVPQNARSKALTVPGDAPKNTTAAEHECLEDLQRIGHRQGLDRG